MFKASSHDGTALGRHAESRWERVSALGLASLVHELCLRLGHLSFCNRVVKSRLVREVSGEHALLYVLFGRFDGVVSVFIVAVGVCVTMEVVRGIVFSVGIKGRQLGSRGLR